MNREATEIPERRDRTRAHDGRTEDLYIVVRHPRHLHKRWSQNKWDDDCVGQILAQVKKLGIEVFWVSPHGRVDVAGHWRIWNQLNHEMKATRGKSKI